MGWRKLRGPQGCGSISAFIFMKNQLSIYIDETGDLVATLTLLDYKVKEGHLSKSENEFFAGRRNLKKVYLNSFRKKLLK